MDWYLKVLKNYVGFRGRARRKEYWMFILVNIIFTFVLELLDKMLGWQRAGGEGILTTIYGILVFLPWWAVQFRRLHDTGRSGWWWGAGIIATYGFGTIFVIDLGISSLINFPPAAISAFLGKFVLFAIAYIAYHIVMIVFLCQDSEPFENRYGESPKYVVDPDSDGIDTPDAKID